MNIDIDLNAQDATIFLCQGGYEGEWLQVIWAGRGYTFHAPQLDHEQVSRLAEAFRKLADAMAHTSYLGSSL